MLLLSLSLNGTAYYFLFRLQQERIRKEIKMMIKAGVPDGELSVIRHTAENSEDFHWIHSREFRYRGVMYDVVRSEKAADGATLLHCVTDHQETLLFANLDLMTKSQAARHPAHSKAIHFYSLLMGGLFTPPDAEYIRPDSGFMILDAFYLIFYQQPGIFIDAPPPQSV
ncbi:hypothetical protein DSECCO2_172600 [anaerobic digester metagenome]